jgi:hypothetical protein
MLITSGGRGIFLDLVFGFLPVNIKQNFCTQSGCGFKPTTLVRTSRKHLMSNSNSHQLFSLTSRHTHGITPLQLNLHLDYTVYSLLLPYTDEQLLDPRQVPFDQLQT